jgi:hypothetical protein
MLKMKYLWALAVAALCFGAMAGPVLAAADDSQVVSSDLPSAMIWDETYDASVEMENTGTNTWDSNYALRSVEGSTTAGVTKINRWGLTLVALTSPTVGTGGTETFDFTVTAPPITGTFECDWAMANTDIPFLGSTFLGLAEADVEITRFPDVGIGHWAHTQVEGCAGLVPYIALGFPDGYFRPLVPIRRDAMAVFIRRGMDISQTSPASATFPDVPTSHWAYQDIEALADAGVVVGYASGYYRPNYNVNREQMAVYVARGKGWTLTTPATAPFVDVPLSHWAVDEIYTCVVNNVVQGYPDGYHPTETVNRAQMAVYCYRAFIDPDDPAVVNGGPGLSDVDPGTATYAGWSSTDKDPAFAYVLFDASLLSTDMASNSPDNDWDITFDFRDAATPDVTGTTVDRPQDVAALGAAAGTHYVVYCPVPALSVGNKVLVVIVEDAQGDLIELPRTVAFRITS